MPNQFITLTSASANHLFLINVAQIIQMVPTTGGTAIMLSTGVVEYVTEPLSVICRKLSIYWQNK